MFKFDPAKKKEKDHSYPDPKIDKESPKSMQELIYDQQDYYQEGSGSTNLRQIVQFQQQKKLDQR